MKSRLAFASVILTLATWLSTPSAQDLPDLLITSPVPGAVVVGATTLQATVTPAVPVTSVVFLVDSQQLCSVKAPPFECEWDAGTAAAAHQIRVVATLRDTRLVRVVRTGEDPRAASRPTFSIGVEGVELAVTVSDGKRFVPGLPASVFHVFEDDKPQTIASFASEEVPLSLVVAVDTSTSMTPAMPSLKAAAKAFLAGVPPGDAIYVLAFSDEIVQVASPSMSRADRAAAIDRLSAHGATSLYDVLIRSVNLVSRTRGRKAVIVFTDGEDQGSQASLAEVERRLQTTDVTLYMIGQGRGLERDALKKVMQRLVQPTGGRAFFTGKIEELQQVFTDLLTELTSQYLVTYIPTNSAHDGRWRQIRVVVDGHHDVRAREGYRLTDSP
jgi:Ca-activated chloride channel family protein